MNIENPPSAKPYEKPEGERRGIVIVNTGDGKGKSSAAFGVMLRSLARGWQVATVQFVKSGDWKVGEEQLGRQLMRTCEAGLAVDRLDRDRDVAVGPVRRRSQGIGPPVPDSVYVHPDPHVLARSVPGPAASGPDHERGCVVRLRHDRDDPTAQIGT